MDKRGWDRAPGDQGRGYPALDGLRGLAAIVVVYYHVIGTATRYESPVLGHGYLAVDLFFALSGFVLFHAYFTRFRQGLSARAFLTLRLIRLYPLYAVGLVIGISTQLLLVLIDPAQAMAPARLLASVAAGLVILPSYSPRDAMFPLNGPCWTLMLELIVNGLMAILWRRISVRGMAVLSVILAAILAVYVTGRGDAAAGDSGKDVLFGFMRCATSFCIGILVHPIANSRPVAARANPLLFGLLCVTLAGSLLWPPPAAFGALYDLAFILLISPLCIVMGARITLSDRLVRLCTVLGVTSYALYVTHCPMIRVVFLWCDMTGLVDYRRHLVGFATGYTLIFALLAYALDRFYDVPVRRWLGRQRSRMAARRS